MSIRDAVTLFWLLLVVACGGRGSVFGESHTPELMAAALVQLVTVDNTFGGEMPTSAEFLILDRIDPYAGNPTTPPSQSTRSLTAGEQEAIEHAVSEYGPDRWIDNPANPEIGGTPPDSNAFQMILGVGEPDIETDTGLVPVSMICGNLCGTWLTYRLEMVDNQWVVTGIEGSVSVS